MPHPTENPNAGVPEPTVPTPRPEGYEDKTVPDPARYDERGQAAEEAIQSVIRERAERAASKED